MPRRPKSNVGNGSDFVFIDFVFIGFAFGTQKREADENGPKNDRWPPRRGAAVLPARARVAGSSRRGSLSGLVGTKHEGEGAYVEQHPDDAGRAARCPCRHALRGSKLASCALWLRHRNLLY
jgi:hypothetical protein